MGQWLVEFPVPSQFDHDQRQQRFTEVEKSIGAADAEILDLQVAGDAERLFVVFDSSDPAPVTSALDDAGIEHTEPAEVRLVGATLDEVRASRPTARWLVEWDLPEGLSMDQYLARKKEKSPLYANVPEVSFQRTWVREDMGKCLCFYDGPDEDAVRCARDAVGAPVDRLYELSADR